MPWYFSTIFLHLSCVKLVKDIAKKCGMVDTGLLHISCILKQSGTYKKAIELMPTASLQICLCLKTIRDTPQ